MSASSFLLTAPGASIYPPIFTLGARTPRDTRAATIDWTNNLGELGVTIASVLAIEVSRLDLQVMTSSDLIVIGSTLLTNLKVAIALSGGIGGTTYLVTCGITQSDGGVVYRSVYQPVVAPLG